jgi:hypothetical protein
MSNDEEDWNDWDAISIPSPAAPLSQWTIRKTKTIQDGGAKKYTIVRQDGGVDIILSMPMLKIYVKKTGKLITSQRSSAKTRDSTCAKMKTGTR